MSAILLLVLPLCLLLLLPGCTGHGRLMDPPARNSMWRLGFPNPVNYNDNELYCGGRITQWARNKGKCGVCGDPHHSKRDHEVGGKYANGIISREYLQGDVIDVTVHITANHKGYFEFRICPVTDLTVEVTQDCLDERVMELANGEGKRYPLPEGKSNQFFNVSLQLPKDLNCKQCVIQWKYRTGNTWDKDENGKFCVGCGPQEEFYNCADVAIHSRDSSGNDKEENNEKISNTKSEDVVDHKKTDIVFSNDNVDMKYKKMSEYGKQKINFIHTMDSNKYSIWTDSAHRADFNSNGKLMRLGQKSNPTQTATSTRFGYMDGDHHNRLPLAKPTRLAGSEKSSSVAYTWKAGSPVNNDFERIRQRFGYGSVLGNVFNAEKQGSKGQGAYGSSARSENRMTESRQNMPRYGVNDYYKFHQKSHARNSASEKVASTSIYPAAQTDAKKIHARLQDFLHAKGLTISQRDNFLRRWKLLRLRHIAALRALNATTTTTTTTTTGAPSLAATQNPNPKQMMESRERLAAQNRKHSRDPHSGSPANRLTKSQYYNLHATSAQAKSGNNNRHQYVKTKLPSWLMTALKLKHQDNGADDNDKERIDEGERNWLFDHASRAGKLTGKAVFPASLVIGADSKLVQKEISLSREQSQEKYVNDKEKQKEKKSESIDWDKTDVRNEDTELLVRYIVSLLLNHTKENLESDQSSDRKKTSDHTDKEESAYPYLDRVRVSKFAQMPWFVPSSARRPPERTLAVTDKSATVETLAGLYSKAKDVPSQPDVHSSTLQDYVAPSQRVQVQTFNNFILGTDLEETQGREATWESNVDLVSGQKNDLLQRYTSSSQLPRGPAYNNNHKVYLPGDSAAVTHLPTQSANLQQNNDHLWAARALKRQGYYQKKPEDRRARLTCESLVMLGEGMDQWCTDNCNANFCPPSMCVCRSSISHIAPPSAFSWDQYRGGHSDRTGQGSPSHRGQNWQEADKFYNSPYYTTSLALLHPTVRTRPRYYDSVSLIDFRKGQASPWQPRRIHSETLMNKNVERPRDAEEASHLIGYYADPLVTSRTSLHDLSKIPLSRQHQQPQSFTSSDSSNAVYQAAPAQPNIGLNWITTPESYRDKVFVPGVGSETMLHVYPQNHHSNPSHTDHKLAEKRRDHGVDKVSRKVDSSTAPEHNQLTLSSKHNERQPRLKCKAIGAYSGVQHFDAWCESTCLSTMCPLLVCSCHS